MIHPATTDAITKSAFLAGFRCEKLLWTRFKARDQIPPPDASLQAIFNQGPEVGALARALFPEGVEVAGGITDAEEVERASRSALRARRPLFELGFTFAGAFARADILVPAGKDAWDLFEVKGVTERKGVHFGDVAFQAYVYASEGLQLRHCFLVHVKPFCQPLPGRVTRASRFGTVTPSAESICVSRLEVHKLLSETRCDATSRGIADWMPGACRRSFQLCAVCFDASIFSRTRAWLASGRFQRLRPPL